MKITDRATTYVVRGAVQDVCDGSFESETGFAECSGAEKHPEDFYWCKLKDRNTCGILECETGEKCNDKANVGSEHMENELLDIVEDTAALFNGIEDGGEIVVCEDNVG